MTYDLKSRASFTEAKAGVLRALEDLPADAAKLVLFEAMDEVNKALNPPQAWKPAPAPKPPKKSQGMKDSSFAPLRDLVLEEVKKAGAKGARRGEIDEALGTEVPSFVYTYLRQDGLIVLRGERRNARYYLPEKKA